jgi:CelD/BcsL family acetyltransferase involved in cellulose biosynthesis
MSDLELVVQNDFDNNIKKEWDETVIALGSTIHMTFDWCRIWFDFYGKRRKPYNFIFRSNGKIVGILPLYIEQFGFGPFRLKVAKLIGSNIPPKIFDPPIDSKYSNEIFQSVFNSLQKDVDCNVISLGPISESYLKLNCSSGFFKENKNIKHKVKIEPYDVYTVFNLPESIDKYYSSLSKSERININRKFNALKKNHQIGKVIISDPESALDEFGDFAVMHKKQWNAEGKPGHFGAWPNAYQYNRALVKELSLQDRVRFINLTANNKTVSSQYLFKMNNVGFWELPAREVGPAWEKYSFGRIGLISMFEAAINEKIYEIAGGLGHYDYKLKLGAEERQAYRVRIISNTYSTLFKTAFYSIISFLLLIVYHKIWYRRIMTRLPEKFFKPESKLWLKFDF